MKRILLLALMMVLVVGLVFSGCSARAPAPAPAPAPTQAPAPAPKPSTPAPTATPTKVDTTAAAAFYKGKNVDFYIHTAAGGGHDAIIRLYIEALNKTSGATFTPLNKAGGGLMLAPVYVATSGKTDGLTISGTDTFIAQVAQLLGTEGMEKEDVTKWNFLGSLREGAANLFVSSKSPYKTLGDIMKAKGFKLNLNSTTSVVAVFGGVILGKIMKMQDVQNIAATAGGGSSGQVVSVIRGEFDAACVPASVILQYKDELRPILTLGRTKDALMPNIPTLGEALKDAGFSDAETQYWVNVIGLGADSLTSAFAPAGVAQDKVEFLRAAFAQASKDPDLQAKAAKQNLFPRFISGADLSKSIAEFVKMSPERLATFKAAMKF